MSGNSNGILKLQILQSRVSNFVLSILYMYPKMRISLVFRQFFLTIMLSTFCITNIIATVHSQCLENQKSLLLEFKESVKFDPLASTKLVQWNQTMDCCSWNGVECDALGHVISLQLDNDTIYGDIENSTSLFSLGYLEKLNLAFNRFLSKPIPTGLYNLTNLTHLNLSNAGFSGQIPAEVGRIRSLVSLDLSESFQLKLENPNFNMLLQNLTGLRELVLDYVNISAQGSEWGQVISSSLPSLRYLSLRNCYLSGPIDSSLSKLRSLSVLSLGWNDLSTIVPDFFANYSSLTTLTLNSCNLQGHFPEMIFQLPTLLNLDISYNRLLSGTIPEFPRGGSFRTIEIAHTNFSGSVPDSISNLVMLSTIDLSNCHFSGPIPSTIGSRPELVHLGFSQNFFTGVIPSFHKAKKLTHIFLSSNSLIGSLSSTQFEGLSNLVYLDLRNNSFNGSIPQSLFLLPSLQQLLLSDNQFSDQVKEFSTPLYSSNLNVLDLSSNRLQGSIPKSLFKLKKLNFLKLSFNFFNGTIHLENFRELPKISTLELGYNNLSVVTRSSSNDNSSFILPSLLSELDLASCNVYDFPNLRNQSRMVSLDISNNQIRGKIPSWIWDIGKEQFAFLNLSCNFFDHLEKPYNISKFILLLDLHSNQLHGEFPPTPALAVYLDYSSNNFQQSIPLNVGNLLPYATFLSLANNRLIGYIPTSFCNATNLLFLDLSGNNLNGSIPPCLMGNTVDLRVLNLRKNNISGYIPDTLSVNCSLQTLDVSNNNLRGKIPASLANCKSLQVMNVGNNKMDDSFPCVLKTSTSLRVLVLRSNRFHGEIKCPGVNQSWPNLQIIDVASNNFSGYLNPRFFASWRDTSPGKLGHNQLRVELVIMPDLYYEDKVTVTVKGLEMELVKILTVFTTFDFSCNKFQGEIPNTIGDLRSLYALNLSHNAFTGTIPASIGNLTQLGSLDLSVNLLTGKIPKELASLNFLSVLNLSFNHLFGMIPTGPQFQTFSPASYEGNVELCGFPLNVSCNDLGASTPKLKTWHLYPKAGDIHWAYVSAALGYVVGLGTTVCSLLYCKNWRERYFEQVDLVFAKMFNHQDGRKRRGKRKRVGRNLVRKQEFLLK